MSGFLRRLSVVLLVIAACFAGVRIYAAGSSSSSYYYTLDDDGAKVAAAPHSWAIGSVTVLSSLPYKPGYGYGGHYTAQNCGGTQIIDHEGNVLQSLNRSTTLYACWYPFYPPSIVLDDAGGSGGMLSSVTCDKLVYNIYVDGNSNTVPVYYANQGDWARDARQINKSSEYAWVGCPTGGEITNMYQLPTRSGYRFHGYYSGQNGTGDQFIDENGLLVGAQSAYNYLSSSVPTTLYAYWTVDYSGNYLITLNDAGGTGGQVASNASYKLYEIYGECYASASGQNSNGTLNNAMCIENIHATPTRTGYNFGGYYTGQNGSGSPIISASGAVVGSNTQFTSAATIYAKWTPKVLTVTLNHQSPTNSPAPSTVYLKYATNWYSNAAATTTISTMTTVPQKTNYTFGGYWTGQNGTGTRVIDSDGNFLRTTAALTALTSNATVYAYWVSSGAQPTWVTVTINDQTPTTASSPTVLYRNTNTAVSGCSGYKASQSCSATTVTAIIPPTKTNYTYGGHWTSTGGSGSQWTNANGTILYNVTSNTTVYAKWTSNSGSIYRMILDPGTNGSGSREIYEKQNVGWFRDSAGSYQITSSIFGLTSSGGAGLTKPTHSSNYTFNGYWTSRSGGTQIIDADGYILANPTYTRATTFYAQWVEPTTSKVKLLPNGGTACAVESVEATYGQPMPTLSCAPTRANYVFTGYFDSASDGDSGTGFGASVTQYYNDDLSSAHNWDKNGEQSLYAHWEELPTYSIKYFCDKSEVESGSPHYTETGIYYGQSYVVKTRAQVGCSPIAGKKFLGWVYNSSENLWQPGQIVQYPYQESIQLAAYNLEIATVTLHHEGANNSPSPSTVYLVPTDAWYSDSDATVEISTMTTIPVKYGYELKGYYTATSGGTRIIDANGNFTSVPGSAVWDLYARYTPKKYVITLDDVDATTASSPNPVVYLVENGWTNSSGTTISSITKPTKTGSSFAGFWTGPNGTGNMVIDSDGAFVTMTTAILQTFDENGVDTLYAKWNPKYTVTFSCQNQAGDGSGTPSPATVQVADGETLTFPSLANCSWGNAGYSPYVWGYVVNGNFTEIHNAGDTMTWSSGYGNRTFNVWYAPNYFNYEYSCGAGSGTPPADGNTYYHNGGWTTAANTCTPPTNKHFAGWLEPVSGNVYAENSIPGAGSGHQGWLWPYDVTAAAGGAFTAQYADDTYTATFTCENNAFSPYVFSGTAPADITDIAYQQTITLPSPSVCTNNYPESGWIVSPATQWSYYCVDGNGGAAGNGSAVGSTSWPAHGNCTFRPAAVKSLYNITYDCNGGTGTAPATDTVDYTNRNTVRPAANTCTAPTGQRFTGWQIGNTGTILQPNQYGGSNALWPYAQNINLRAQWEPDTYSLTWGCGDGTGTPSGASFPTTIDYGETLTFPANTVCTAPTGYEFAGWTIDINATTYQPNGTFTWNLTSGSEINASFTPVKVDITYSCGTGATGTAPAAQNNIDYGSQVQLRALGSCAKTGHSATKWVVSNTSPVASYDFGATVSAWNYAENKTLTPNWSAETYTITYELNGGTQASSGVPSTYTYGVGATINGVPTALGAEFAGWCDSESLTNCAMTKTISATATGNKKYWAKWSCATGYEPNDIWFDNDNVLTMSGGSTTFPGNTPCIPGRYVIHCDGNGGVACFEQVSNGTSDGIYMGQFYDTDWLYSTEFTGAHGFGPVIASTTSSVNDLINNRSGWGVFTKNPASVVFTAGPLASLTSSNNNYINFINWYANQNSKPQFGRDHYTFAGLWTQADGGVEYIPASGYMPYASGLTGNQDFVRFFTSDSTVYAHWTPDIYSVTLNANKAGDTSGTNGIGTIYEEYESGWATSVNGPFVNSLTLTAAQLPTRDGYTFKGYYNTSATSGGTQMISAAGVVLAATDAIGANGTTWYARWEENKYNVTYVCNGPSGGPTTYNNDATFGASYNPKTLATVGCASYPGHTFTHWEVSGDSTNNAVPGTAFTWNYTENKTFTAHWTDDTYTITFHPGDGVTTTGTTEVKEWYSHAYRVQSGTGSMSWTAVTEITLPTKTGYTFAGYYNNPSFTGTPVMTDATLPVTTPTATYFTADADLYAKWTADTYDINYVFNGGAAIPSDYMPVEYIQGNGSSYINTNVSPASNFELYLDIMILRGNTQQSSTIFGTNVSSDAGKFVSKVYSTTLLDSCISGNCISGGIGYNAINQKVRIGLSPHWVMSYTGAKRTLERSYTSSSSAKLQLLSATSSAANGKARIYLAEMYNATTSTLQFRGVPVRRKSDGVCGLYNMVNGVFLTSATSTPFSCPDIEYSYSDDYIGNITGYPKNYTYGTGATISGVPTRANSTFVGWCENSGLTNNCVTPQNVSATATGDKTFYAKWTCNAGYTANAAGTACTPNTITLTYNNGGHGTAPTAPASCVYGENVNLPAAISVTGYTFNKWAVAGNNFAANASVVCNSANLGATSGTVIITATWLTDSVTCAATKYLPAGATICADCVAGNYCPGGTFTFDENNNQGITVCATNKYSNAAAASCTDCMTANGYTNSGSNAANHAYESSCKTTCSVGQCVATARAACANVGTTGWATGGVVAQGDTLACNACANGTSTCGYGTCADEAGDCGRVLRVGENQLYLRSNRKTDRTLNVKIGNNTYYANMSTANLNMSNDVNKSFKVKVGNTIYSVYDDSVTE